MALTHTLDKPEKYFTGLRTWTVFLRAVRPTDRTRGPLHCRGATLNIPIFAIVDTDCDPWPGIPRGARTTTQSFLADHGRMAAAIERGQAQREALMQPMRTDHRGRESVEDAAGLRRPLTLEELGQNDVAPAHWNNIEAAPAFRP